MSTRKTRAVELADGMEACINEYLAKAAPDASRETISLARCCLGTRLAPHCGCCFCLPELEEV
jgi:hypothetical protein